MNEKEIATVMFSYAEAAERLGMDEEKRFFSVAGFAVKRER